MIDGYGHRDRIERDIDRYEKKTAYYLQLITKDQEKRRYYALSSQEVKNAEVKNYLLNTKYNQVHFNVVEVDSLKHGKSLKIF